MFTKIEKIFFKVRQFPGTGLFQTQIKMKWFQTIKKKIKKWYMSKKYNYFNVSQTELNISKFDLMWLLTAY